ncbi:peptidoglycan -binding protein [Amaricoccus tamworthensis]|uniref:peptidoglycan -binding protein n=1 Tax=Amaricoccus tamworthensis TaxID=57002 RepID=UPI003C7A7ADA
MALSRRASGRFSNTIWPGFVDAMTALILVLFFVLSIFMIVQFVLRDTITGQTRELGEMSLQVANLADALGLERTRADTQENLVATLTTERDAAEEEIRAYESRVASLLERNASLAGTLEEREERIAALIASNASLTGDLSDAREANEALTGDLTAARKTNEELLTAQEALELALTQAREEIDAGVEQARLAAAKREALEDLVASLESDRDALAGERDELQAQVAAQTEELSDAEKERIAEAAAAEALRERLANADAELTAMTLNLERERQRAEDTLTLLAAAEAARDEYQEAGEAALSASDQHRAEMAQARALLAEQEEISAEAQRQVALLNQQTAELRSQLDELQGLLDDSLAEEIAAQVQIETLGANLNAALARVAAEEKARAELEAREAERLRIEAEALREEAQDLESYRSEFFGRMSRILGAREGVQVVGDRFVFDSEVLFSTGSANLNAEGREQVARVAQVIRDISDEVPAQIDWILRVDGHTDKIPLGPGRQFRDNWELSQARALSVVRYMIDQQGIPADRLAATGFGEFQPVDTGDSPEALARNRRIEIKFTER